MKEAAKEGKISYTFIITGPFADWGLNNGFLGFDLKNHQVTLYDDGQKEVTFTPIRDVGRFIVATLKNPSEAINKSLFLGSFTTTQSKFLEAIEKVVILNLDISQKIQF